MARIKGELGRKEKSFFQALEVLGGLYLFGPVTSDIQYAIKKYVPVIVVVDTAPLVPFVVAFFPQTC